MSNYQVYFSDSGVPATDLTAVTFTYFLYASGLTSITSPTILTAGNSGWRIFSYAPTETVIGVIDGGSGLADADRYVPVKLTPYDDMDSRVYVALPAATAASTGGLAVVDANNLIAGIQGSKNQLDDLNDITSAIVYAECNTAIVGAGVAYATALSGVASDVSAILLDTGTDGVVLAASQAVNVTKLEGTSLSAKVGDNFNVFFQNGGADTSKIVNDVGTGTTSSSTYTMTIVTQTAGGTRIPWVTVTILNGSGTAIGSFTTDSNGSYSKELDAGTFTFKPYKPEYNFTNTTATVSVAATITLTGAAVSVTAQFTPADVLELIRHQVYETGAGFWSDAEVYAYMWQAESEIAQIVECTEASDASVATVSGTQEYPKPADCLYVKRVLWDGVALKCIDWRDKDVHQFNSYGQTDSSGNPHSYYEWGDNLGLYPIPSSAKTITIKYIKQPPKISSSTTYFTVPKMFHNAIIEYCLSRMYAKDQDESRATLHWNLWIQNVGNAKGKWAARNKSNRFHVVKNEDNYPQTDLGII